MTTVPTREETITGGPPGAAGSVLVDRMPLGQLVVHAHEHTVGTGIDGEQVALQAHAAATSVQHALHAAGRRSLVVAWRAGPAFVPGTVLRVGVAAKLRVNALLGLVGRAASADLSSAKLAVACDLQLVVLGESKSIATSIAAGAGATSGMASSKRPNVHHETIVGLHEGDISTARTLFEVFEAHDTERLDAAKRVSKPFAAETRVWAGAQSSAPGIAADARVTVASEWSFTIDVEAP